MTILGVTTSSPVCGIALMRGGVVEASDSFVSARACVEELVPRIERLLAGAGIGLRDIEKFAVDVGPGGLTGIKIGLSTVKTLAQALDRPIVPVSSLLALCRAAPPEWETLVPIAPCMKNEYYAAIYARGGQGFAIEAPETVCGVEGIIEMIGRRPGVGKVFLIGAAAIEVRGAVIEAAGNRVRLMEGAPVRPGAEDICEIAAPIEGRPFFDVQPNYLCLTHAERNLGAKV